jgi:tRNA(adenine34) deaminase
MEIDLHSPERFMGEALRQARMAYEEGEIPVGAVVVCENRIIARAYNQTERLNDPTAHAEMLAITAAAEYLGSKYLETCTMYVTLEPCPMCAGALFWSHIGGLVYGAPDPKMGFTLHHSGVLHPRTTVSSGVLQAECSMLLSDFFDNLRN